MEHIRGAPIVQHPFDRALTDYEERILLESYYLPGDLERQIGGFVDTITSAITEHRQSHVGRRLF